MSNVKLVLAIFVAVTGPLLWVAMWWWIAKSAETATAEIRRHPSLRKYAVQTVWAVTIWLAGTLPLTLTEVLLGHKVAAPLQWAGLAVQTVGCVAMCVIWRNKAREIRRLSNLEQS